MDVTTALILHSIIYRLAMIGTAVTCIVLGYRLFSKGVFPEKGTAIDGKVPHVHLSIKNAAPGTCFAFFGCFIIVVMLFRGPEFFVPENVAGARPMEELVARPELPKLVEPRPLAPLTGVVRPSVTGTWDAAADSKQRPADEPASAGREAGGKPGLHVRPSPADVGGTGKPGSITPGSPRTTEPVSPPPAPESLPPRGPAPSATPRK